MQRLLLLASLLRHLGLSFPLFSSPIKSISTNYPDLLRLDIYRSYDSHESRLNSSRLSFRVCLSFYFLSFSSGVSYMNIEMGRTKLFV